ncbi:Carboxylic acid transporter [Yamadazyma tenuis]|uniref:Carboxylic acid transporter n=1 Tax=Candida tenuis TaxID=2315449 RepID=UPI0027AACDBD|nr:Carboxylic acid transporter [Yamadazyma tenuis]
MSFNDDILVEHANNQIFNEKPELSLSSISHYFGTRFSTLFDIPYKSQSSSVWVTMNPIPGLKQVDSRGWNFYFLGFLGWTVDAMDFFCVSATAPNIALTLNVSITQVTWGITLVLMFRSLGATIFGLASDYYGRKYTYILVCLLFVVIEIGTGFVKTYGQFLGVRALFGIAMGGFYPICATTALEDQPTKARGILSGLFLPGYNLGYIFAMAFFLAFEHTFKEGEGWRSLFWFSAGLPCILITWRFFLPETQTFIKLQEQKKILKEHDERAKVGIYKYLDKTIVTTIKTEWVLFIYLVLLMAGFNFTSHGVVYQLGNLASSASSTIEAQIGTQFPIGDKTGSYDYGLVMAIFCGAVFGYMIIIIILGPERYHRDLGIESDTNSIQRADDSEGASTVESKEVPEHVEQKV